jgi:Intracellular proteinase inhibitor
MSIVIRTLLLGFVTLSAFAYSPDYFPLQVGNQWVYRGTLGGNASLLTVSVTATEEHNGQQYAVVTGWNESPMLVRQDDAGTLFALGANGAERVLAMFPTAEGAGYAVGIDSCTTQARVESRNATVNVPAGSYPGALLVRYSGSCADAGRTSETFLPWIGLVRREFTTFAGPQVYELVYSRTGGVTILNAPETAVSLSITRNATVPLRGFQPPIEARLTLRATGAPLELNFPSSQRVDFAIRNEQGETVYFWSATRLFAAVIGKETVGPGERNWAEVIPANLAPGKYTLEGWLTTTPAKRYMATVGFEIVALR